ncbi:hypothetical protein C7475_101170 [Chitinophaga sp. S165]|nr:hypothetical protein C7475_101170 [Chitinophaga sp. S165]
MEETVKRYGRSEKRAYRQGSNVDKTTKIQYSRAIRENGQEETNERKVLTG